MRTKRLGGTDLAVSRYCLGTMTWGNQTRAKAAHRQIDLALDRGVDFIDTAEMYPVNPVRAATIGRTERIVGLWLERTGRRDDVVLATKQTGTGNGKVRDGAPITPETLRAAVEGSLRRLKTDHIDLYQFHWPNRGSYHFRQNWSFDPSDLSRQAVLDDMAACLGAMEDERRRGTVRHFGLSNETAWGMSQWIRLADAGIGPRPVSIQNEYSLLCRLFDTDLAEVSLAEDVGLLAYSPLAAGMLTGKYRGGAVPAGSRMTLAPDLGGRRTDRAFAAVEAYLDVAARHDLNPARMAISWAAERPFMTSVILGATSLDQLDTLLAEPEATLPAAVTEELDAVHRAHPLPY